MLGCVYMKYDITDFDKIIEIINEKIREFNK